MMNIIQFRTLFRTNSKVLFPILIILTAFSCVTNPENRPSPLRVETGKVDSVKIELTFSSPSVKNRKIFGDGEDYLEPYGELWRTGANKATSIQFSDNLLFADIKVDSGKYSIFTIPNEEEWTLIFNKNWDQWGEYDYQDSLDVLRLSVPIDKPASKKEQMRLFIENDQLKFEWELATWSVPIASLP